MFRLPIQIGLVPAGATPPAGWYPWATTDTTARMRRHAQLLDAVGALPDRVTIVRAVPGLPPRGLLDLCAGDWPVSGEEIAAERRRLRGRPSGLAELADRPDDEIANMIRSDDPQRGYALVAPVHLTERRAITHGAGGLYSSYHSGRIRWSPDGWLVDEGWCGSTRTVPGRPAATAAEAADRLAAHMRTRYVEGMRAMQAETGDVGWQAYAPALGAFGVPAHLSLDAVVMERHRADFGTPRILARTRVPAPRWADHIRVQPSVDGVDMSAGTHECLCPDCGGHVRWHETAQVAGYRRCHGRPESGSEAGGWRYGEDGGCGAEWCVERRDGWVVLERVDPAQIGTWIGEADLTPLAAVTVPDAETRIAAHRAGVAGAKAARDAEEKAALAVFRSRPALAPHCNGRGLRSGAGIALRNGMTVVARGPVRIGRDNGAAQAQVDMPPDRQGRIRRVWMALAEFA